MTARVGEPPFKAPDVTGSKRAGTDQPPTFVDDLRMDTAGGLDLGHEATLSRAGILIV